MSLSISEQYRLFEEINDGKAAEAIELITRLRTELGINFAGKRVIDVGCRLCHKAGEMRKLGADVYGVDPFKAAIKWGSEQMGFIKPEQAFDCFVQDLPKDLYGTFDLVTMFMYRVCPPGMIPDDSAHPYIGVDINDMQLQVTKKLAKLIKPDGMVIIEIINNPLDDDYLFWPNSSCTPLMYQMKKVFEEAEYVETSNRYSLFITAKKPFDNKVIDQLSFVDVCMPSGLDAYLDKVEHLTELGCYYTGTYSPFTFEVNRGNKSLRYISK
jgi:2-polyprenyl-3-methyl-5-hydroxy-6-metoxy-1,4-benzoquinol methylase